jgi:hypothetical protein
MREESSMIRAKLGLLSLCVVMSGLMALGTGSAQAESGAKWLILTSMNVLKESPVPLPGAIDLKTDSPVLVLHTEILKIKVLVLCTGAKAVNANLLANGGLGKETVAGQPVGAQFLFTGCTVDLNGAAAPECTPNDPVDGTGKILTKLLHGLLVLYELGGGVKDDVATILPDATALHSPLATIVLPVGCPVGTSIPIIGELAVKDCQDLALTHLVEHLVEVFTPLTSLFAISLTVEHQATLLGSVFAKLIGAAHEGLKWSGDWA